MTRVNPSSSELGRVNAIVGGRARRYEVHNFASPLSVKAVFNGTATWTTAAGRFELGPSGCLIINGDEEYSIEIDALQPVETFCIFFRRGFVEEAHRSAVTGSAALLDDSTAPPNIEFAERLQDDPALRSTIERAHRSVPVEDSRPRLSRRAEGGCPPLEDEMLALANRLVELHTDVAGRVSRLPALRASTREEIRRRLDRAIAVIHGDLGGDLSLERIAGEACLAPFHFHRLFTSYSGETPHRYVTRLRLQRAATLLAGSERPVTEIALDCGFESAGSFTTLFSRHFGAPPSRFRKN
jgi:AraC family transcriptional regulator